MTVSRLRTLARLLVGHVLLTARLSASAARPTCKIAEGYRPGDHE